MNNERESNYEVYYETYINKKRNKLIVIRNTICVIPRLNSNQKKTFCQGVNYTISYFARCC